MDDVDRRLARAYDLILRLADDDDKDTDTRKMARPESEKTGVATLDATGRAGGDGNQ